MTPTPLPYCVFLALCACVFMTDSSRTSSDPWCRCVVLVLRALCLCMVLWHTSIELHKEAQPLWTAGRRHDSPWALLSKPASCCVWEKKQDEFAKGLRGRVVTERDMHFRLSYQVDQLPLRHVENCQVEQTVKPGKGVHLSLLIYAYLLTALKFWLDLLRG